MKSGLSSKNISTTELTLLIMITYRFFMSLAISYNRFNIFNSRHHLADALRKIKFISSLEKIRCQLNSALLFIWLSSAPIIILQIPWPPNHFTGTVVNKKTFSLRVDAQAKDSFNSLSQPL